MRRTELPWLAVVALLTLGVVLVFGGVVWAGGVFRTGVVVIDLALAAALVLGVVQVLRPEPAAS